MPNAHLTNERSPDGICDMAEIPCHKEVHPTHGGNRNVKGIDRGEGWDCPLCDEGCGQFRYAWRGDVEFWNIFKNIEPFTGDNRITETDLIEDELRNVQVETFPAGRPPFMRRLLVSRP